MGSDLPPRDGEATPTFIVWAAEDALSGNPDRVQFVKGWTERTCGCPTFRPGWSGGMLVFVDEAVAAVRLHDAKVALIHPRWRLGHEWWSLVE